jgi:hypothetical protein
MSFTPLLKSHNFAILERICHDHINILTFGFAVSEILEERVICSFESDVQKEHHSRPEWESNAFLSNGNGKSDIYEKFGVKDD